MQDTVMHRSDRNALEEEGASLVEYVLLLLLVLIGALIALRAFSVKVSDKFSFIVSSLDNT